MSCSAWNVRRSDGLSTGRRPARLLSPRGDFARIAVLRIGTTRMPGRDLGEPAEPGAHRRGHGPDDGRGYRPIRHLRMPALPRRGAPRRRRERPVRGDALRGETPKARRVPALMKAAWYERQGTASRLRGGGSACRASVRSRIGRSGRRPTMRSCPRRRPFRSRNGSPLRRGPVSGTRASPLIARFTWPFLLGSDDVRPAANLEAVRCERGPGTWLARVRDRGALSARIDRGGSPLLESGNTSGRVVLLRAADEF